MSDIPGYTEAAGLAGRVGDLPDHDRTLNEQLAGYEAAREAAREALRGRYGANDYAEAMADRAVAAALPFLDRATRDKIAAEIETDFRENVNDVAINDDTDRVLNAIGKYMYRAARVARGGEATE